jgi:hypothetical protein
LKVVEPAASAPFAPMLIQARTPSGSPFTYLQREPPPVTRDEKALERRRALWTFMAQALEAEFSLDVHESMLATYEAQALAGKVVLQATRQLADRGATLTVPITLSAPQRVRSLRFGIAVPGDATLSDPRCPEVGGSRCSTWNQPRRRSSARRRRSVTTSWAVRPRATCRYPTCSCTCSG